MAEQLHRFQPLVGGEIDLGAIDEARQVGRYENNFVLVAADKNQHPAVFRQKKLDAAFAEGAVTLAQQHEPLHPPEQRAGVLLLRLDVDRFIMVLGIDDHRQKQLLRVGAGEAGVAVGAPLHGRAHAVTVAEIDVVAHADFVAVIDYRRPRQREQEAVQKLHAPAVVAEQGRQAAPDAQVDPGPWIVGVDLIHVIAVFVRDHLQGQLVMIAQEHGPLAGLGDRRRLLQDIDDRETILHVRRHEQARHDRKVKRHVALVPRAEIGDGILGPLVGLGEQHPVFVFAVHMPAQVFEQRVGLRQIFTVGALALEQIGHGVQAQPVHPQFKPEVQNAENRSFDLRVIEVQVRLVRIEAMPVVSFGHRVPGPVRNFKIFENDARLLIALLGIAPDVEITRAAAGLGLARTLKPGMLVGGMIDHQLGDDTDGAAVRFAQEHFEVFQRAVVEMNVGVIGDIVAIVAQRRRIERQEPERRDTQVLQIIELFRKADEIADAVAVAVAKSAHMGFVNHRFLVPAGLIFQNCR